MDDWVVRIDDVTDLVRRTRDLVVAGRLAAAQAMVMKTDYHHDAVSRFLNKQPRAFEWSAKPKAPGDKA
mgnify:CR=1 FL=1